MRAPVVDVSELRTKTTNINWKLRQEPLPAKFVEHCKHLLGLAQRENRDEYARPAVESLRECLREPPLFAGSRPALRLRVIAPGTFHDHHIEFFFREDCCLHDCLVVEIDVTGVKHGLAFGAHQNSS